MIKKVPFILFATMAVDLVQWVIFQIYFQLFVVRINPFVGILLFLFLALVAGMLLLVCVRRGRWAWKKGFTTADWFLVGCLSWIFWLGVVSILAGNTTFDIQLQDTYFVIAHGHVEGVHVLAFGVVCDQPSVFRGEGTKALMIGVIVVYTVISVVCH
jgi:hypothetical protein